MASNEMVGSPLAYPGPSQIVKGGAPGAERNAKAIASAYADK